MLTVSLKGSSPAFASPGRASGSTTTGRELGTGTFAGGGGSSWACALVVGLRGVRVRGGVGGAVSVCGVSAAFGATLGLPGVRAGFGASVGMGPPGARVIWVPDNHRYCVLPLRRYPGWP